MIEVFRALDKDRREANAVVPGNPLPGGRPMRAQEREIAYQPLLFAH
jgi:hypothetical protein